MEDQAQGSNSPNNGAGSGSGAKRAEPVRSRWTPKPEQILILESIFNSGMVNPPKNETVRIRKLLEKFGAVGDANVFYWFQNRRSRSRRRQRQMQAAAATSEQISQAQAAGAIQDEMMHHVDSGDCYYSGTMAAGDICSGYSYGSSHIPYDFHGGSSSSCVAQQGLTVDQFFPEIGFPTEPVTSAQFQSGTITVFINGVQTEIPRGPLDMRSVFGEDGILVHSSGIPVPTDGFGSLMQSLEHGESYFLVSRPT
ncbi:hypothetical protein MLD38_007653 [Melastoma candidum]|uniref:Uncharacterized protein n=1 Tax=Melastoma candidum TaxID=119954 RepID=A0ACB9RT57_9MYRT|nr:hypothetical protein MLD38_007653 [Melastoma candidum]